MTTTDEDTTPRTLTAPTATAARDFLRAAIERGELVTVFGRCTVEYDGRASSYLGPGDRHVMLKPDGSLLVHTATGQKPVNWQPPGCTHEPSVCDDSLQIRSLRTTPAEELSVTFEAVEQLSAFSLSDESDLDVSGTEADLKQRILDDPSLIEPGFQPLATERETPAGAVDIFGRAADGTTVVVELKRRRVGPDAVGQLARYVDALRRDLHTDATIRGILVAPSVTDRARDLLDENGLEFVALEPE
ncbi:endonuclease NucS [Haladaptatus sp. CMSO5]|uniref:endonuclease NucS n=1 Tax=Haladaptatus sp. CMSO5 TaxID=3120514 RepID=UPI002FCE5FCA